MEKSLSNLENCFVFDTETNYTFCKLCIRRMCLRDVPFHKCKFKRTTKETYIRMERQINLCKRNFRKCVSFSIYFLRSKLGKDIMVKIMKIVVKTRHDLCLWDVEPKIKYRKERKRRQKGIDDFYV